MEEKKKKKLTRKQIIQSLIEDGKKKGVLDYKEINNKLEALELDSDQIEKMFELLEKHGIEIVGSIDEDDDLDLSDTEDLEISQEELQDLSVPSNKEKTCRGKPPSCCKHSKTLCGPRNVIP